MLFAGKTKSGSNHLWPWWWVFLFGGHYQQTNGGYGRCYSIPTRIRRYYREDWSKHCSLIDWIWNQSPYGLIYLPNFKKNQYKSPVEKLEAPVYEYEKELKNVFYLDCFIKGNSFPVNTYYDEDPLKLALSAVNLLISEISGIHSVTLSRETKGMSPIRLKKQ